MKYLNLIFYTNECLPRGPRHVVEEHFCHKNVVRLMQIWLVSNRNILANASFSRYNRPILIAYVVNGKRTS